MKIKWLAYLFVGFISTISHEQILRATTVFDEGYNGPLDTSVWKIKGPNVSVMEGCLIFRAEEVDETKYANSILEGIAPNALLNFTQRPLTITLSDVQVAGSAPAGKRAFILVIGSNNISEMKAEGYVRLCLNGDGTFFVTVPDRKEDGQFTDKQVVNVPVNFPVKKLVVRLDAQGCKVTVDDQIKDGTWGSLMQSRYWEKSTPWISLKAIRRASPGNSEVTLGGLKIENE